jgi:hypothetical protein
MTEQDVRDVVEFVRSRQPRFYTQKEEDSLKVFSDDYYWVNLYDRRSELLKGSREYDEAMDEVYIQEALRYFSCD